MFALNTYLQHLGFKREQVNSNFASLSLIVQKHLETFRYQNTYLYEQGLLNKPTRKPGKIDKDAIYQQLVVENTPGYCFQNIELLFYVLEEIGFNVSRHLSRVYNKSIDDINFAEASFKPYDHEVLSVVVEGKTYFLDTGFANNSLRQPLLLQLGEQQFQDDCYRISDHNHNYFLELQVKPKVWLCLYEVVAEPCNKQAIEKANEELFFSDYEIPIRDSFRKLAIVTPEKRKFLLTMKIGPTIFKSYKGNELYRQKEYGQVSDDALEQVAVSKFGLSLK